MIHQLVRAAAAVLLVTLVDSQPRVATANASQREQRASETRTVRTVAERSASAAREKAGAILDRAVDAAGHVVDFTQQAVTTVQERAAASVAAAWVPPRDLARADTTHDVAADTTDAAADTRPAPTVPADTTPVTAAGRDTVTAPGDTLQPPVRPGLPARALAVQADTAQAELVQWPEPDSVVRSLEQRAGYVSTRYQGDRVSFHAPTRGLEIQGQPAAVGRGPALLVGDTITYNDLTQIVVVRGDTNILRDPEQHTSDVVARGSLTYDLRRGQGAITGISTAVASGEQWYVQGQTGFFIRDTAGVRPAAFYVRQGSFTSCDEEVPDYHFRAGQIKMITRNFIVARPATLYIGEVPVLWLPFVFQDIRSGRRSGILSPRLGVGELVRNSPLYRRHIENLGYYFALNDYMDGQLWLDWRSGARGTPEDPGWTRWNGEYRYRWLNRFMTGRLAASHTRDREGNANTAVTWGHQQEFSQTRRFTADVNYVTNTRLQRQNAFDPRQVMATISSRATYQQKFGPMSLDLGGTRTQYPGRSQVAQTLPTLALAVPTLALGRWFEWSPNFRFDNQQTFDLDQPGTTSYRYTQTNGLLDSVLVRGDQRSTTAGLQTPFKIFGFTWQNSFTFADREDNYQTPVTIVDPDDPTQRITRVFDRTYQTGIDWQTGITLPGFLSGTWNFSPSISFRNVDPRPFWVRTQFTGGRYVRQGKRMDYSLSVSPTFFGLFPGIGPTERIRHSITPRLTYAYSPAAQVDDEFLRATNQTRNDYLGTLAQNQVTLSLSQVFEARLSGGDTAAGPQEGRKIKLLSLNFSPLTYDFERARKTGRTGISTSNLSYDLASDLLPGFSLRVGYSLFQGNPMSDTAVFKPFREDVSASFTFNQQSSLFAAINRIFGRAVPQTAPQMERLDPAPDDALAQRIAGTPVAGSQRRDRELAIPSTGAWQIGFTFSSNRQREPVGGNIIEYDPQDLCQAFIDNPLVYSTCLVQQQTRPTTPDVFTPVIGAPFVRIPPRETLQWDMNFHVTPRWAAQWRTTYDFRAREFASHQVTLQRELHDWRSNFAFTKAPNGNFSFMFYISMIAQPDVKFNYDRHTYRPLSGQ